MATYCTADDVKNYLNSSAFSSTDSTGDFPSDSVINSMIENNEEIIDELCDTIFTTKEVTEYYDHDASNDLLILDHYPVVSVSAVYELQSDYSYEELTETRDRDMDDSYYLKDEKAGIIILSDPITDVDAYKVTYTYGYSSVPKYVKKLCILMTVRDIINRLANSTDSPDIANAWMKQLALLNKEIEKIEEVVVRRYRRIVRGMNG